MCLPEVAHHSMLVCSKQCVESLSNMIRLMTRGVLLELRV